MSNNKKDKQEGIFSSLIGEKTPSKTSGLVYTVAACTFFFVSLLVSMLPVGEERPDCFLYVSFLAAPVAFLLVGVWYFSYTKHSFKQFVKEQNCSPKYYLLAIAVQIGLLSLSELNIMFLSFLEKFGYKNSEIILPSMDGFGFVGVFLTVAVLPAIMEEFVFRGLLLREMQGFSLITRALIGGGLFALYHQNPAQTIYQGICGMAFALVAARAGSFLPTALAHLINNGVILVLTKLQITSYGATMYAFIVAISALCLGFSIVYLLFAKGDEYKREKKKANYGEFFVCAAVGIFIFFLSWLATLFVGFSG